MARNAKLLPKKGRRSFVQLAKRTLPMPIRGPIARIYRKLKPYLTLDSHSHLARWARKKLPPSVRAPLGIVYRRLKKARRAAHEGTVPQAIQRAAVGTTDAVIHAAVEALPIEVLPLNATVLRTHFIGSMRKGRIEEDAKRLLLKYLTAPLDDQKIAIQVLADFVAPKRLSEFLTLFSKAYRASDLHLLVANKALERGDAATAESALDHASGLTEEADRPVEHMIAEASLALIKGSRENAASSLAAALEHPKVTVRDLVTIIGLSDTGAPHLIASILARMQTLAKGAHRITAAKHLYEYGEDPGEGMTSLSELLDDPKLSQGSAYWIGRYLRHAGYLPEALAIFKTLSRLRPSDPKPQLEMAEIAIEDGNFREAIALVRTARANSAADAEIFSPAEFTAYASRGSFRTAWALYKKRGSHRHLRHGFLQGRYVSNFDKWQASRDRLLIAVSGLGDEIRWSSGYRHLPLDGSMSITCDPRLYPLFQRSFPHLNFIPVKRRYKVVNRIAGPNYDEVPTAELTYFFDNHGWARALRTERVTTMYDAISSLLPDREAIECAEAHLSPDPLKVSHWKERLPRDLPRIAISWRSDLLSYARTQHYLPFDAILDVIRSRPAHWYILQGGLTIEEKAELSAAADNRLTYAEELLDTRDDLDNLSAFLKCMDLTIAPAIANLELAGAIGATGILMSRSKHVSWRISQSNRDIWFKTLAHAQIPLSVDLNGRKLAALVKARIDELLDKGAIHA